MTKITLYSERSFVNHVNATTATFRNTFQLEKTSLLFVLSSET